MKEKDYIEEIILNNLEELNNNEPGEGHFKRFEAKLNRQQNKKRLYLNVVWKVAAAVIFVFLVANQAAIYLSPNQNGSLLTIFDKNENTLSSVSTEYKEVEFYYTNSINVGLDQWNVLNSEGLVSAEEQKMMETDLKEFEELYKNLQADLATNPNDERVINAMLEYYQTKLGIINMIVNKLQEVKNQKNTSHETEI